MPENKGFYQKYNVQRKDGRDQPGGDRHGATYFVLDLDNDRFAKIALKAYADACASDLPELHEDLYRFFDFNDCRHDEEE